MKPLVFMLAATLVAVPLLAQAPRAPAGDVAQGQRQFMRCQACHTVTRGGENEVGPNLWGVVGARAASKPGFAYSPALSRSGIRWTPAELDAYIARPNTRVPGGKMVFGGMADPVARRNLIAYLGTLKR